ncbi:MAG TPA: cytotoxic translational repressor of toxin-antitoxin stability system [Desulfobacter sp.]|jgi:mRNA-degrading endonuclease RelE of RelBE toxin-antitoxin system|nr:cytotoxic translational repressor of toxin-antitoxin stability system [Desulfobacter sp.]
MNWTVTLTKKAAKAIHKLPISIRQALFVLLGEIENSGPVRGNWKNYSKLGQDRHHCHLKKGQPTYVAVWEVTNKEIKLIEVIYVGSHEKAPY